MHRDEPPYIYFLSCVGSSSSWNSLYASRYTFLINETVGGTITMRLLRNPNSLKSQYYN